MQLDPVNQKKLLAMSDDQLWMTIRTIAARGGLSLPAKTPAPEDLSRLREAIAGFGNQDIAGALTLLQGFARGEGHG